MTGEISDQEYGDHCPSCGSRDVVPWVIDCTPVEMYGYRCGLCQSIWPVMAFYHLYDTLTASRVLMREA